MTVEEAIMWSTLMMCGVYLDVHKHYKFSRFFFTVSLLMILLVVIRKVFGE